MTPVISIVYNNNEEKSSYYKHIYLTAVTRYILLSFRQIFSPFLCVFYFCMRIYVKYRSFSLLQKKFDLF